MPKRTDINSILVLGSGPIVIGQACEFDYSGTQGCKALQEEGCRIILLNSNPATVMTDPGFSDRTYIEPMTLAMATAIIKKERPDALLPTLGGQTALNLAMELHKAGVLEEYGVEMIGARPLSIEIAESRQMFRQTMQDIGLDLPKSGFASTVEEAELLADGIGFPVIIRPSYTLGGSGGGVAYNKEELRETAMRGLMASPVTQILVEESVLGWKEIELEVVRDKNDNAIVICGIENLDPMGVHTGDSITVAPIQTLSDVEYQALRSEAIDVVRAVGVDTGGCNIQFAIDPKTGRRVIIEMNPRVSRSSALASKATGFPIARVAAKLALGYSLDELRNDITGTSACFEPTIDYCVVKVPRFNFEKFSGASPVLGLRMHSVGETMSLGGNFREALQKALRGLETGMSGLQPPRYMDEPTGGKEQRLDAIRAVLHEPRPDRIYKLYEALQLGMPPDEIYALTGIDLWFLLQMKQIAEQERFLTESFLPGLQAGTLGPDAPAQWKAIKADGFSDARLAELADNLFPGHGWTEERIRRTRLEAGVKPFFRSVDTCAGEFPAITPYFYSTFDAMQSDPPLPVRDAIKGKRKVLILGGGPNRIGQGIEFDYCCVQASFSLKSMDIATVMVNCNPETVSTDYDTSDILYFEPVTVEDILAVCEQEKPDGVIVQFGGQTPLNLAQALERAGVPILGTKPEAIFMAEDRDAFSSLVDRLGIPQPPSGMAFNEESACRIAKSIGYPVIVRPSFVLGGRAMRIIHNEEGLRAYVSGEETGIRLNPDQPILVDKFLEDAVEVDVDAVCDGEQVTLAAVMEHIEQAGIHSGDSCCSIPARTLSKESLETIREYTRALGLALKTVGLLNMQFAVHQGKVYILEANPRASRTVPFVSKAVGLSVAGIACQVMSGRSLKEIGFTEEPKLAYHTVKEAVIPFERFPGTEINLGPEMRSTGEVMGIDHSFGRAFLKAQAGAGTPVPTEGGIILSVTDRDKKPLVPLAKRLAKLGFTLYATPGTKEILAENGIEAKLVVKIGPERPHLIDLLRNGEIGMIVNTVSGPASARDATTIRAEALARHVALLTTIAALAATVEGLESRLDSRPSVGALQDFYQGLDTSC